MIGIYLRVSTDRQGDKQSLPEPERFGKTFAPLRPLRSLILASSIIFPLEQSTTRGGVSRLKQLISINLQALAPSMSTKAVSSTDRCSLLQAVEYHGSEPSYAPLKRSSIHRLFLSPSPS
jgi:hypothetical protein